MKLTSIFAVCALALLVNACEQHPTVGEPPMREHGEGAEAATHEEKAEPAKEKSKPAEPAAAGEKPQFFPDKAEKK